MSSGNFIAICSLKSQCGNICLILLPFCKGDGVTASPNWSNRSRPIRGFRPSGTTVNESDQVFNPLPDTGVWILPSKLNWLVEESSKLWFWSFGVPKTHVNCC